jgi:hypothetical protein
MGIKMSPMTLGLMTLQDSLEGCGPMKDCTSRIIENKSEAQMMPK